MMLSMDIKQFVKEHENDDINKLALQAKRYPTVDIPFTIRQISGKQVAKQKIPTWYENEDIIYPKHLSLEQSSSEATAKYKARLVDGESMVDLTGGMGVDFSFLSVRFSKATYVEQQEELAEIANHNMAMLGLRNVLIKNEDSVSYLQQMEKTDLIYIDPARRDSIGKKTVLIEDCAPNLIQIDALLNEKSSTTMIKLSPMLDISLATKAITNIAEIHVISINNECKELLFIKKQTYSFLPTIHCINIVNDRIDQFSFSKEEEEQTSITYSDRLKKYLYEPNSSIIKAGAYKSVARQFTLDKLHVSSHLYTSDSLINEFSGRKFEIEAIFSLNKKDIKEHLSNLSQANITTRNFPLSVDEIRKRTKLKDGGNIYIFATTLADEKKVLILCKKL